MTRIELHGLYLHALRKGGTRERRSRAWRERRRKMLDMLQPFEDQLHGFMGMDLVSIGRSHGHYLDIDGAPQLASNLLQWCVGLERCRRVEVTQVGEHHVSTVFLGLEHNFTRGTPILYETMIFHQDNKEDHTWLDFQRRYSTRQEALAGHYKVVTAMGAGGASSSAPARPSPHG